MGDVVVILKIKSPNSCHGSNSRTIHVKLISSDRTHLISSQHWLRLWFGTARQQAVIWTNVAPNLCRHMASLVHNDLTHLPIVPHIWVRTSDQHWFRYWLVAYSSPSHYLNQWWVIVNWTPVNKLQWNSNQNTKFFINENRFENVVCEMVAILSRGR